VATSANSKQDQIYAVVRERLIEGIYAPGHRINVAEISRELGVSNIPVREALRRLEAEEWLEHAPNVGMRVAARDQQTWLDLMTPYAVLAGFATAEASAPLRADGGVVELRAINADMFAAIARGDYAEATAANGRFHERIFSSVVNPELRRSVDERWTRLHLSRSELYRAIPERALEAAREHDELIAMIESGADHMAIEAMAREHTLKTVAASRAAAAAALKDRA
jgi:DNA-binding GntR family transcriptional regulator